MKVLGWLLVFALGAAAAYWLRSFARRRDELARASEKRMASFMAEAMAKSTPADPGAAQQRLLFDAAAKAGEAGEPVLAIQLYARLIARFPQCALATQARAAVEAQKKKIAKA